MQDYCKIQRKHAHCLTSYSNEWKSKLKQQSSLSSYHTTKRAQLQTVRSPDKLAQLILSRCEAIEQVIASYSRQVERMYPGELLGTVHKHYRTDSMKKAFKTARAALSKLSDELETLHKQERKAQADLHDADVQCENLSFDSTASKNKLSRAKDNQEKKQHQLEDIKDEITRLEQEYDREQENYLQKARAIYYQCRELEKERLDQIQETLIKFSQAAHTSEYSAGQDAIFDDLIAKIKTEQDSTEDLDFWAQTYHVEIFTKSISSETNDDNDNNTESQTTTRKPKKSHKNEPENLTTIEENTPQPVVADEEEQSATNTTTTAPKTKAKKNKNSTSTEKKNSSTTEPTTPNATKSNQV
jgi:archaellum component FlaC